MASLPIYNKSGDQVGKYEIDPAKIVGLTIEAVRLAA